VAFATENCCYWEVLCALVAVENGYTLKSSLLKNGMYLPGLFWD